MRRDACGTALDAKVDGQPAAVGAGRASSKALGSGRPAGVEQREAEGRATRRGLTRSDAEDQHEDQ